MSKNQSKAVDQFCLSPIGVIHRDESRIWIAIDEPFREALTGLEKFSHVMVFWWFDKLDTPEYRAIQVVDLPYAPGVQAGVFATRSPVRPNPLAMTTCRLMGLDREKGILQVADIDAVDGSPVVDLKAYFPVCDRVQEAHIPDFLQGWPEWMPEAGSGLMPGEEEAFAAMEA